MAIERPHQAFPFHRGPNGKIVCVEQDTAAHIQSCEASIANCQLGAREERPEFGWNIPVLSNIPLDPTPLVDALNEFEPRVTNRTATEYQDLAAVTAAGRVIEIDDYMPAGVG